MSTVVTGAAGFIGYHVCRKLLSSGNPVVGIDNLNDYYDVSLKHDRLKELRSASEASGTSFEFYKVDIQDKMSINQIFSTHSPTKVLNLAAQAGVRYSLQNPSAYTESNIVGFLNILEVCRTFDIKHLVYASSSSVYGGNIKLPFSEADGVDHPVSLYAVTKKSNELMAHSYSHLFGIPTTGLRFFTAYGPWGRPDMALFIFTKSIIENKPINIFNNGEMVRDFTYIDDVVESIIRVLGKPPSTSSNYNKICPKPNDSWAPYRILNVGNSSPVPLMDYIQSLETVLGKKAQKNFLPMQDGDVAATIADTSQLEQLINFKPSVTVHEGIRSFVAWYKSYYGIND